MANTCRTEIHLHANQSTIDWFEKLTQNFDTDDYIGQFSSKGSNLIDKIGSKWLIRYDWGREDEHEYFLSFESAWYPPNEMVKNMVAQLQQHDPHAWANGRYWDENFSPIGIFQCNSPEMWDIAETDVEVDWDNEYYWDEEVEPAFEELEL